MNSFHFAYVLLLQQGLVNAESSDFMRETGKIHVVYGVLTIIFLGISVFLFLLERRINKLEKRIENEQ